jgi:hypothetical protein
MTDVTVGADLLANVAAALAATSQVMAPLDAGYSALALNIAQRVYTFATINATAQTPSSYCRFVPCESDFAMTSQQLAVPVSEEQAANATQPLCW